VPPSKIGEDLRRKVRDYMVSEPSFTVPFASWELGVSRPAIRLVLIEALKKGWVEEIEPAATPYAAVYAYNPPPSEVVQRVRLPELDAGLEPDLAPRRGVIVPHTRSQGPTSKPGETRKRQQRGVRIKRRT
jgi:hypothetical protein